MMMKQPLLLLPMTTARLIGQNGWSEMIEEVSIDCVKYSAEAVHSSWFPPSVIASDNDESILNA